jgi:hypothetical protein
MADGTSLIALPLVSAFTSSVEFGVAALGGYFLAPPIIHGAHGRWGIAAGSLGLRVGLPVLGGLLGAAADDDCRGEICVPVISALGITLGALGAVALDASLLSFEEVDRDVRGSSDRAKAGAITWSPLAAPRKEGGFTLGLGATF